MDTRDRSACSALGCAATFAAMPFPSAPPEAVAALSELLRTPRRIAITTHYNPDGDALGSSLGLLHVLKAMGHHVQVVLPNPAPKNLHWMPGHAGAIDWIQSRFKKGRPATLYFDEVRTPTYTDCLNPLT